MKDLKWFLINDDFNWLTNDGGWHVFLSENGITSPDSSFFSLLYSRSNYDTPDCPHCQIADDHYESKKQNVWKCKKCRKKFSLTTGTYIHNTKLPLHCWDRFSYLVGDMNITNSLTIANDLNITQKTSWGMIDTLRNARKNLSKKKFLNGPSVLVFDNKHQVLNCLLQLSCHVSRAWRNPDAAPNN